MSIDDLIRAQDHEGVVHLADESPLGGFATGCDTWETLTVVARSAHEELCGECLAFWQPS